MQAFKNVLGWILLLGIGYNVGYWVHEIQDSKKVPVLQQQDSPPNHQKIQLIESPEKVTWI